MKSGQKNNQIDEVNELHLTFPFTTKLPPAPTLSEVEWAYPGADVFPIPTNDLDEATSIPEPLPADETSIASQSTINDPGRTAWQYEHLYAVRECRER